MREELLLNVPHRQVVFTIPKMLGIFFKYNRNLLGELCRLALRSLNRYFEAHQASATEKGVSYKSEVFLLKVQTEGLEAGEYLLYLFAEELTTGAKSQANAYFKAK